MFEGFKISQWLSFDVYRGYSLQDIWISVPIVSDGLLPAGYYNLWSFLKEICDMYGDCEIAIRIIDLFVDNPIGQRFDVPLFSASVIITRREGKFS